MESKIQHSIDYITQKTGKKSGFSVPNNYFEEIDDNIFNRIVEEKIPNKNSFKVPKDYFLTVEDKILSKVIPERKKQTKVIALRRIIEISAIASVLLLISLYLFNNNITVSFDNITIAEIEDWYNNSYEITNDNEIAILLDESDFINTGISSINIDESVLEDYFNSTDSSNLIQEIQ